MAISKPSRATSMSALQPASAPVGAKWRDNHTLRVIVIPLTIAASIALWELLVRVRNLPPFILPSPGDVWVRLLAAIQTASFWGHVGVTLVEVAGGLLIGGSLALAMGYVVAKSRLLSSILSPIIVASQAIPIVAVAPLLAIWFGYGLTPKIVTSPLIVFFPILISVAAGIRSIEPNLRDLMRSLRASRRQMFLKLEVPAALPMVFSGLRVGATLSVIGAIVGEFVNSDRGLGFLIKQGNGEYDTARTFVALFALVSIALILYGSVALIERRALAWKR